MEILIGISFVRKRTEVEIVWDFIHKTTRDRKSGCGRMYAGKGVDHERFVVVL